MERTVKQWMIPVMISAWGVSGCAATTALEGYPWRLVELAGAQQISAEAHIVFDSGPPYRVSGSTGCNRFAGPYKQGGSVLEFGQLAMTKMACPDSMAQEQAFTGALASTRGWRVAGGRLELLDALGLPVARFEQAR